MGDGQQERARAFNRTRLGLKRFFRLRRRPGGDGAFNRTRLGLKPELQTIVLQIERPLIAPGWD